MNEWKKNWDFAGRKWKISPNVLQLCSFVAYCPTAVPNKFFEIGMVERQNSPVKSANDEPSYWNILSALGLSQQNRTFNCCCYIQSANMYYVKIWSTRLCYESRLLFESKYVFRLRNIGSNILLFYQFLICFSNILRSLIWLSSILFFEVSTAEFLPSNFLTFEQYVETAIKSFASDLIHSVYHL